MEGVWICILVADPPNLYAGISRASTRPVCMCLHVCMCVYVL